MPEITFWPLRDWNLGLHFLLYAGLPIAKVTRRFVYVLYPLQIVFDYSHEKKKKYWEQLELRCRHLYRRPQIAATSSSGLMLTPAAASQCGYCSTDDFVRYYNTPTPQILGPPGPPGLFSQGEDGCYWNPSPRGVPQNFYSPNPETGNATADPPGNPPEVSNTLSRSLSRSFRNWFPWLSNRIGMQ